MPTEILTNVLTKPVAICQGIGHVRLAEIPVLNLLERVFFRAKEEPKFVDLISEESRVLLSLCEHQIIFFFCWDRIDLRTVLREFIIQFSENLLQLAAVHTAVYFKQRYSGCAFHIEHNDYNHNQVRQEDSDRLDQAQDYAKVAGEQARLHNFRITSLVHGPGLFIDGAHNLLIGKPLVYKLVDEPGLVVFEFTHQIQHMRGQRILDLDLRRFHRHEPFIAPFQCVINLEQKHKHQHNAKQIDRTQTQKLDLKCFQYRIRQFRVGNLSNLP
jgi:hypothetical protein